MNLGYSKIPIYKERLRVRVATATSLKPMKTSAGIGLGVEKTKAVRSAVLRVRLNSESRALG